MEASRCNNPGASCEVWARFIETSADRATQKAGHKKSAQTQFWSARRETQMPRDGPLASCLLIRVDLAGHLIHALLDVGAEFGDVFREGVPNLGELFFARLLGVAEGLSQLVVPAP